MNLISNTNNHKLTTKYIMRIITEKFTDNSPENLEYFKNFPFELDDFQKHAIIFINKGENILITAHTGSGKSVLAEYGIIRAIKNNKKIIYTSPIKSLSNQKFFEFKKKFQDIGILTGDIKFNPMANILIMTTEILRNLLYNKKIITDKLEIEINISDVEFVIFDEIHYITDLDRGHVWEESLILLPQNIQLILLSATLDKPEKFAGWLENIRNRPINLIQTNKRPVPLNHYYYIHNPNTKNINNNLLDNYGNKLNLLFDQNNKFYPENYEKLKTIKNNYARYISKSYNPISIINNISEYLITNNLVPAIFFVFSRKKTELYANTIKKILINHETQNKIEKLISEYLIQLPDHKKYLELDQFKLIKNYLLKGIAIHHSGLIPIFKELIELLFSQNLIKIIFATETFAVGINFPTKSVLFTGLYKPDKNIKSRILLTHEYIQMAGRAGRRGIDTTGIIIILPNLFELLTTSEIQNLIMGKTQNISSKFLIDYYYILKSINSENIISKSLLNTELENINSGLISEKNKLASLLELYQEPEINIKLFEKYFLEKAKLSDNLIKPTKNQEKNIKSELTNLKSQIPDFNKKYGEYLNHKNIFLEYNNILSEIDYNQNYIITTINNIIQILIKNNYLRDSELKPENLTIKGLIASQITETNLILLTELISNNYLDNLSEPEIACLLSIFLDTPILELDNEEINLTNLKIPNQIKKIISELEIIKNNYISQEKFYGLQINIDWNIYKYMLEISYNWACNINPPSNIYEGNFIRDMLKLSSFCVILEKISEIIQNNNLLLKIKNLEKILVRDIVNTDSLYIR